ncbi:GNAT family N-acetyltransferase [Microaceticoccus formicicus]|uniref:GNAT family N-acetyltransferase n=1 Tax=Microaceticoccus formicicus TaxID=3118105 RepID=UPI003CD043E1|nr:GNAT family N-acetyltransferase [Peptoniphilaceae bacterium AMB_02]
MIRLANIKDLDRIIEIINDGKKTLADNNIAQWSNDYPSRDVIMKDIENSEFYVMELEQELVAVMSLIYEPDSSYDTLKGGQWQKSSYTAVHRLAVASEHMGNGYAFKMLEFVLEKTAELGFESVRIDTHEDNLAIIKIAEKLGFEYRGIISFESSGTGVAYEKIIDRRFGVYLKTFEEFSIYEVYDILKLRQDVFIVEQKSIFHDIDEQDYDCLHYSAYKKGELIGYIRILPPGMSFDEPSMGRYCVSESARGQGVGKVLFEKSISYIHEVMNEPVIRIEAQSYLAEPYKRAGFKIVGEEYDLDGVPHIEMLRNCKEF